MDAELYRQMYKVEDRHWWFKGRRAIVATLLQRSDLPIGARILDLGCGTGGNLSMLSQYGDVLGLELDKDAAQLANQRKLATIVRGRLPDALPLIGENFDCVVMLDVLEHIDDDFATLSNVYKLLTTGGRLLLTVPAFPFVWSTHDEVHHHYRRYRATGLRSLLMTTGYNVDVLSYYNSWLFPPIVLVRRLQRFLPAGHSSTELVMPPKLINMLLTNMFSSERYLLGRMGLPFGLSLIALAVKP